jgi:hypothetical protein
MPLVAQAALPYPSTASLTVLGEVSQVVRVVK